MALRGLLTSRGIGGWRLLKPRNPRPREQTVLVSARVMEFSSSPAEDCVVPKDEVVRFIADCMECAGASHDDACIVAHHLMTADYRGHFSHGMNRVQMYIKDIEKKLTDPTAKMVVVNDCQAIALVDGCNGLGQVVGKCSMELAIEKAKKYCIGMVVARGSNHYGIAGYYSLMAMNQGMIGFSCSNTSPLMAPTRSKEAGLGTNPLSLGMCGNKHQFVLDMATTAVALGKIELARRKNEQIPEGWALDKKGKPTTDPKKAAEAAKLMPLGGAEKNSGYKGSGLAFMVEVLCGVIGGSNFGPNIRKWTAGDTVANLGHCFMAINPEAFGDCSRERLDQLVEQIRCLEPVDECKPVMVAGDKECEAMRKVDCDGGISYHPNQLQASEELAAHLGVKPMQLVMKTSRN